ncbi:site-specific DNA-methyltransferase, partial [Listeria monocytogenes]|nr:site-specific DNA-methyltransferase [Listeria monocytogenes]
DKPTANSDHPTMKPVDLIAAHLNNSCPVGGIVLDLFAGSGSTLAAAFMTGRRAALVELDPRYADVIVTRWEALSGDTAEQVA